jgi:hypothetical protein
LDDKPTLQYLLGAAGGGAAGYAADRLLNLPPGTASILGVIAGGAISIEAAKHWPDLRQSDLARASDEVLAALSLIDPAELNFSRKLDDDLFPENTPLPETFVVKEALEDLHRKIPIGTKAAGKFRADLQAVKENYDPSHGATRLGVPDPEAVALLRGLDRPIRADCTSIEPAVLAAVGTMRDRFGIPVQIGTDSINGRHQVLQAGARLDSGDPFDLILCATAPFLFYSIKGAEGAFQDQYRFLLPIHKERQYLLRKPARGIDENSGLSGIRVIRFLELSSAEEQFQFIRIATRTKYTPRELHLGDIPLIANALRDDEAIVLYEPAASAAMRAAGLIRVAGPISDYDVWIGMFGASELVSQPKLRWALVECFVAAWVFCDRHRKEARFTLSAIDGALEAFRAATAIEKPTR